LVWAKAPVRPHGILNDSWQRGADLGEKSLSGSFFSLFIKSVYSDTLAWRLACSRGGPVVSAPVQKLKTLLSKKILIFYGDPIFILFQVVDLPGAGGNDADQSKKND